MEEERAGGEKRVSFSRSAMQSILTSAWAGYGQPCTRSLGGGRMINCAATGGFQTPRKEEISSVSTRYNIRNIELEQSRRIHTLVHTNVYGWYCAWVRAGTTVRVRCVYVYTE